MSNLVKAEIGYCGPPLEYVDFQERRICELNKNLVEINLRRNEAVNKLEEWRSTAQKYRMALSEIMLACGEISDALDERTISDYNNQIELIVRRALDEKVPKP